MPDYPKPPYSSQKQSMPGLTAKMDPRPDHGEASYKGAGRLNGKRAIITGGDSGIGRAVAIAFAREGADVLIAYLEEHEDAKEVAAFVEAEGRKVVLVEGDLRSADHCRKVVDRAVRDLGGVDILVNNAAHRATFKDLGDISDEEWRMTFDVNIDLDAVAHRLVDEAKRRLGERGPVWWKDGAPDFNRHAVKNTPYADWCAGLRRRPSGHRDACGEMPAP